MDDLRSKSIVVRLTPSEKEEFNQRAKQSRLSLSAYVVALHRSFGSEVVAKFADKGAKDQ